MAIALVWLSGREPMVIALVQLSAGNAICVMGPISWKLTNHYRLGWLDFWFW